MFDISRVTSVLYVPVPGAGVVMDGTLVGRAVYLSAVSIAVGAGVMVGVAATGVYTVVFVPSFYRVFVPGCYGFSLYRSGCDFFWSNGWRVAGLFFRGLSSGPGVIGTTFAGMTMYLFWFSVVVVVDVTVGVVRTGVYRLSLSCLRSFGVVLFSSVTGTSLLSKSGTSGLTGYFLYFFVRGDPVWVRGAYWTDGSRRLYWRYAWRPLGRCPAWSPLVFFCRGSGDVPRRRHGARRRWCCLLLPTGSS